MNVKIIEARNVLNRLVYRGVLKPIFFRRDPEMVHDLMIRFGIGLGEHQLTRSFVRFLFDYADTALEQTISGITFRNPIGLAAGFDKNAELTNILPSVGFGFTEVGSVTGKPCKGNDKPRLWRLKKSKSLLVYYGLKNDGCEAIAGRLRGKKFNIPLGVSIAMTNCKENVDIQNAIQDYAKAFTVMEPIGDYVTVNISCPNALGGQPFVKPNAFNALFDVLDTIPTHKPIFIKLSPDLTSAEVDALLAVAHEHRVHGIICTNLTKKRDNPKILDTDVPAVGGISGKVVQDLSDKLLAYIYKKEGKRFILIGCGGVFSAEDAYRKIRLGASLVQMITGMIFEGPQVVSDINAGLTCLLRRDGFAHLGQAIGADNC